MSRVWPSQYMGKTLDWESEGCEDLYLCDCDSNVIHHPLFFNVIWYLMSLASYFALLSIVIGDWCLPVIHYTLLQGYSLLLILLWTILFMFWGAAGAINSVVGIMFKFNWTVSFSLPTLAHSQLKEAQVRLISNYGW